MPNTPIQPESVPRYARGLVFPSVHVFASRHGATVTCREDLVVAKRPCRIIDRLEGHRDCGLVLRGSLQMDPLHLGLASKEPDFSIPPVENSVNFPSVSP